MTSQVYRVLAIDPGTVNLGLCVLEITKKQMSEGGLSVYSLAVHHSYTHNLKYDPFRRKQLQVLKCALDVANGVHKDPKITMVAVERQMRGQMLAIQAACQMWALDHKLECYDYHARNVKSTVGLKCCGNAQNKRNAYIIATKLLRHPFNKGQLKSHHEADAMLTALHCAVHMGYITTIALKEMLQ